MTLHTLAFLSSLALVVLHVHDYPPLSLHTLVDSQTDATTADADAATFDTNGTRGLNNAILCAAYGNERLFNLV